MTVTKPERTEGSLPEQEGESGDERDSESAHYDDVDDVETESTNTNAHSKHDIHYGRCRQCLSKVCCKCILDTPETWPRTCSLCLGVVLPLWSLILISAVFGSALSNLEASGEYDANDLYMEAATKSFIAVDVLTTTAAILPEICAEIYFDPNRTLGDLEDDFLRLVTNETVVDELIRGIDRSNETELVNVTDMLEFMDVCGDKFGNITEELARRGFSTFDDVENQGLTFNWIRCVDKDIGCTVDPRFCDFLGLNRTAFLPSAQEANFAAAWYAEQEQLFEIYYQDNLENGMSGPLAALLALDQSSSEATGRTNCTENDPAGAWFWFTVMSTIGYGNQSPQTTGGKAMIYTLGFASILTFGGILANSGYIVTSIFDDFMRRFRYHADLLATPLIGSLLWGSLYYLWMTVIAGYTKIWNQDRLDEEFAFSDGFWFAFISTTTVGLGDFYLEPAVLQNDDLLTWPLLFLFGFVLLANFVVKFSELVSSLLPEKENPLTDRLANTKVFNCFGWLPFKRRAGRNDGDQCQDNSSSHHLITELEEINDGPEQNDLDADFKQEETCHEASSSPIVASEVKVEESTVWS